MKNKNPEIYIITSSEYLKLKENKETIFVINSKNEVFIYKIEKPSLAPKLLNQKGI